MGLTGLSSSSTPYSTDSLGVHNTQHNSHESTDKIQHTNTNF